MSNTHVGLIGIVVKNRECTASKVNQILSDHAAIIVGRMGVPYDTRNVSFISLMIDANEDQIKSFEKDLQDIKGISVSSNMVEIPKEDGCMR
ncbi:MAG TPA: CopG family transcriptional regulator [Caldisericia bacterium]|mgnify:CR=1 FL=1|jgi:putative iron-only hydrogenase system regulator|nr:CopG family transcriptional regulator [Caldisericia bacterium]HXK50920.1 CopG family transcriptional regulator [Caldisericia bacterium]